MGQWKGEEERYQRKVGCVIHIFLIFYLNIEADIRMSRLADIF